MLRIRQNEHGLGRKDSSLAKPSYVQLCFCQSMLVTLQFVALNHDQKESERTPLGNSYLVPGRPIRMDATVLPVNVQRSIVIVRVFYFQAFGKDRLKAMPSNEARVLPEFPVFCVFMELVVIYCIIMKSL